MRAGARVMIFAVAVVMTAVAFAQGRNALEVYFIDVEGGQATLFVSPSGESMLIDAGFPGARDGERIAAAAKDAGLSQIDYFLNTHFHGDHFGSIPDLVGRIPVRTFVDHGTTVETGERSVAAFKTYTDVRDKGKASGRQGGRQGPDQGAGRSGRHCRRRRPRQAARRRRRGQSALRQRGRQCRPIRPKTRRRSAASSASDRSG